MAKSEARQEGAPTSERAIIIQPADPQVVDAPSYNPTDVYGTWPYPATPPVYLPPPPSYAIGTVLATGLAFAAGAAVVGSPASYGDSGIMMFIVNQDGVVFQKDLGEHTATLAAGMKLFDPDLTWARADVVNQ